MTMDRMLRMAVAFILLIAATCWAQSDQPLGDVARKKSAAKAKVVVTEDDLPARPAVPAAKQEGPQASSGQTGAAVDANTAAINPKDAAAETQTQLDKVKNMENQELRIIGDFEKKIADPDTPQPRREIYQDTLLKARTLLEDAQKQRQALEAQLASQQKQAEQKQAEQKRAKDSDEEEPEAPSPQ